MHQNYFHLKVLGKIFPWNHLALRIFWKLIWIKYLRVFRLFISYWMSWGNFFFFEVFVPSSLSCQMSFCTVVHDIFFYPFVSSICSDILGFILILEMCHSSFFICQLYWKFFNVIGLLKRTPSFFQWFFSIASLFPISLAFLYLLFSSFHLPLVYFAPPFLISWGRNLGNWFRLLFSSATPESPLVLRS